MTNPPGPPRLINGCVKGLLRIGVAGRHTYLLSVRGRRSSRTYSTPVILVENGERWLVAPYGEVSWVRNARAAGQATLSRGRRREEIKLSEVGPQESAPVLRQYLRHANFRLHEGIAEGERVVGDTVPDAEGPRVCAI